ncbi:hypothetical protein P7C71_g931, partial [Lecanoromycetidae sp. Uapishka_2]
MTLASTSTGPIRQKAASPLTAAKRRHIKLDFELFRDGEQCTPSMEQQDVIFGLFPTSYRLTLRPPFLIVFCEELPPKPWPITVAGLPLFLTGEKLPPKRWPVKGAALPFFLTNDNASPINHGLPGRGPKKSVKSCISLWKTPDLGAFQEVFGVLDDLGANVHRLQWIGTGFLALATKEPYEDWRSRLPFLINKVLISYIFGEQDVEENAVRRVLPQERVRDNTSYNDLRPGIMISSRGLSPDPDTMTTSGICLDSQEGDRVITVSSQGFPGGVGDKVFHPTPSGRVIGKISKVVGETDIALARLEASEYSRETFSATDKPATSFRKLLRVGETQIGSLVYMDTPVNGFCEGVVVIVDVSRVVSHPDENAPKCTTDFVVGTFTYYGNGGGIEMLNGSCGGVIWNDDNDVVGQFRFQNNDGTGLCYNSHFDPLVRLGYKLSGD